MQSSLESSHDRLADSLTTVERGLETLEKTNRRRRALVPELPADRVVGKPRPKEVVPRRGKGVPDREGLGFMQKLGEILDPLDRAMTRFGQKSVGVAGVVFQPALRVIELLDAGLQRSTALARSVFATADTLLARVAGVVPLPRIARTWLWVGEQRDGQGEEPIQAEWRKRYRPLLWMSVIASVLIHAALFRFAPEMQVDDVSVVADELTSIELPPDIEIPPPPQRIARPATPIVGTVDVAEDVTIATTTFADNPVEDLPPPPEVHDTDAERDGPAFTPYTVAPRILNADEVAEAMRREYPPLLRQAGIGGQVIVWVHISTTGEVEESRVFQSSGRPQLDEAALRVSRTVLFSPALNRDQRVPVWIQFPLTFGVR